MTTTSLWSDGIHDSVLSPLDSLCRTRLVDPAEVTLTSAWKAASSTIRVVRFGSHFVAIYDGADLVSTGPDHLGFILHREGPPRNCVLDCSVIFDSKHFRDQVVALVMRARDLGVPPWDVPSQRLISDVAIDIPIR